ncbi:hypothetical protein SASPL_105910 [Salvia splendens]|uniref:Folate receptor-like domain-containing protein n=1 Tax=Salvia splendens TaxID=180675 RepID=A0A8X8YKU4_SALSN|nr:hypothetical protein SASPL_105910 [Salvia splendens]
MTMCTQSSDGNSHFLFNTPSVPLNVKHLLFDTRFCVMLFCKYVKQVKFVFLPVVDSPHFQMRLASSGEASQECLQLWEFLECSICDPRVGVQRGPPIICGSFCDRVYEACSTAYFAMDGKTQALAPCSQDDFVCGRASEWVSNGTELCNAAGFSVKPLDDPEESRCYGGKGSLDYIANSWKSSRSENIRGEQNTEVVQDFMQLIADMPLSESISWAVGGMILTAGLIFASRRKIRGQRRTQAAIQGSGRRLGTRISPPASPVSQGNRKTVRK